VPESSVVRSRGKATRWWAVIAAVVLAGGCDADPPPASPTVAVSAVPGIVPMWTTVSGAGGCPALAGLERVTDGPFAIPNGVDNATSYVISCSYGQTPQGPAVFLSIDIDRGPEARGDRGSDLRLAESTARSAGHIVLPIAGVGGGALAVANRNPGDPQHPIVLVSTWSRNAFITANVRLDGPVRGDADLAAHEGELARLLNEVLGDLRP
jgi:hypothetical protein